MWKTENLRTATLKYFKVKTFCLCTFTLYINSFLESVLAVSPFISQLTRAEIENYWQDFMNEARKNKNVKIEKCTNNNEERIRVVYRIFVVYAVKPL